MPENAALNGRMDDIEVGFVEREATPESLTKLSIQPHPADLSLSNAVSILELFGAERVTSTDHNYVHEADRQPEDGRSPDHVAVDETVIRRNDEQDRLYAAVDPEPNELLHTTFQPTGTRVLAHALFTELCEKLRYEKHENRDSVERTLREATRRTTAFSNWFGHASA